MHTRFSCWVNMHNGSGHNLSNFCLKINLAEENIIAVDLL